MKNTVFVLLIVFNAYNAHAGKFFKNKNPNTSVIYSAAASSTPKKATKQKAHTRQETFSYEEKPCKCFCNKAFHNVDTLRKHKNHKHIMPLIALFKEL